MSQEAPVLFARSYLELGPGADPTQGYDELIRELQEALRSTPDGGPPGPLLPLPFEVLAFAITRNLAADVSAINSVAINDLTDPLAADYFTFLRIVRDTAEERRTRNGLGKLLGVTSGEALAQLFGEFPELASARAREIAVEALNDPTADAEARRVMQAQLNLLDAAGRGEFERAYDAYLQEVGEFSRDFLQPRIQGLLASIDEFEERRQWQEALAAAEELAEIGRHGMEHVEAEGARRAANVLFEMAGPGRAERLERARLYLRRAAEIYAERPELTTSLGRSILLQNMAAVVGDRFYGDAVANLEESIDLLREALQLISMDDDGRAWAMTQTNLGLALLRRADTRHASQFDWSGAALASNVDEVASQEIEEAITHFNAALLWRSFERDPRDWAYTEINLGLAYARRRVGDREQNLRLSLHHYSEAHRGFMAAGDSQLAAQSLHNIASDRRNLALLSSTAPRERSQLLDQAVADARSSLSYRTLEGDPVNAGRTLHVLGDCLIDAGRTEEAKAAYRDALRGLSPTSESREAGKAARSLARLSQDSGDWQLAADAWDVAAEAAASARESRATSEGRRDELEEHVNVFRLAAFALAKAGRLQRAVEILELGRARELILHVNLRHVDGERLRLLDPGLAQRFVSTQEAVATLDRRDRSGVETPLREAARIREAFAAVVAEVRRLPGFDTFLGRPKFADLPNAVSDSGALAYVLTTPSGSLVLVVTHMQTGLGVAAIETPSVTAGDLMKLFIHPAPTGITGYMAAHRDEMRLRDAILAFSPLLGDQLLAPLNEHLQIAGATDLCLVPIGLMGLLPLHAIEWGQPHNRRCLVDELTVRYAPSGAFQSIARQRTVQHVVSPRAVVVGNPLPQTVPLDGAEFEAKVVAATVPAAVVDLLVAEDATKVDDLATALLMSKFYETLVTENTDFADALRRAQLWLRTLTPDEEEEYIRTRPILRAAQRAARGNPAVPQAFPYSSVTKWGAFVFSGF